MFVVGEGMANNLLKSGRDLAVWNRTDSKSTSFAEPWGERCVVCESPAEVFDKCSLVYCMLSTPEACKAVYEMEKGVIAGVKAGKSVVDCATLAAEDQQRMSIQVKERGGRFLEAPVSGSKGPAATGQLIFLCAGDEELFKEIKQDLDAMGKASLFLGESGAGARMKLAVNMVMGMFIPICLSPSCSYPPST